MTAQHTTPLRQYLQPLFDHYKLIAVIAAITAGLGIGAGLAAPTSYSSSSAILVYPVSGDPTRALETDDAKIDMPTELRIAESQAVIGLAAEKLAADGVALSEEALGDGVVPDSERESTILDITFEAPTARQAQAGADALAQSYLEFRSELAASNKLAAETAIDERIVVLKERLAQVDSQLSLAANGSATRSNLIVEKASIQSEIEAQQGALAALSTPTIDATRIIDQAQLPDAPQGLSLLQILVGAIAGGLVLGVVTAHVVSAFAAAKELDEPVDASGTDPSDDGETLDEVGDERAAAGSDGAVAAAVPSAGETAVHDARLRAFLDPVQHDAAGQPEPEAPLVVSKNLDDLIDQLQQFGTRGTVVALAVAEDDPATAVTVAVEVGDALQALGARVLVIDANIDEPILGSVLGRDDRPGLAEVLTGETTLGVAAEPIGRLDGLDALPVGSISGLTAAAVSGAPYERLLAEARVGYDSIVVIGGRASAPTVPALAALSHGLLVGTVRSAGEAVGEDMVARLVELHAPVLAAISALSTEVVADTVSADDDLGVPAPGPQPTSPGAQDHAPGPEGPAVEPAPPAQPVGSPQPQAVASSVGGDGPFGGRGDAPGAPGV